MTTLPWPLSETSTSEADRILALPPKLREKAIDTLKREIKDGTLARRKKQREQDGA